MNLPNVSARHRFLYMSYQPTTKQRNLKKNVQVAITFSVLGALLSAASVVYYGLPFHDSIVKSSMDEAELRGKSESYSVIKKEMLTSPKQLTDLCTSWWFNGKPQPNSTLKASK